MNFRAAPTKSPWPRRKSSRNIVMQRAALRAGGMVAIQAALGLQHRHLGRIGLRDFIEIVDALLRVLLGRFDRLAFEALTTVDHRAPPGCVFSRKLGRKALFPPCYRMPAAAT